MFRKILDYLKYYVWGNHFNNRGVVGAYYWIRCHVWNRYHIVNVSGMDEYKWGWIDRDHLMLLANFKILKDFVEQEDPMIGLRTLEDYGCQHEEKTWQKEVIERQLKQEKEIRALYYWWCYERPQQWKEFETCDDTNTLWLKEEELLNRDDEMLIRLMKIRQHLWT